MLFVAVLRFFLSAFLNIENTVVAVVFPQKAVINHDTAGHVRYYKASGNWHKPWSTIQLYAVVNC